MNDSAQPSQPSLPLLPPLPSLPSLPLWLAAALCLFAAPANAQRLPSTVRPSHYTLAFDVNLGAASFTGDETIAVDVSEATNRILLNAVEITFREVLIEAGGRIQKASVSSSPQVALLTLPRAIPAGPAIIRIKYTGKLNDQLRGFYLSQANGRRYAVSQMESTDARRAFPSFDEPAFKATFDIALTIDQADTAISNGRVLSDTPGPGANRHTLRFSTSPKMSSYLVALAVGDFKCLEGSGDGIPIRVCATPDKMHLGSLALGFAREIVAFYNRYYDIKYPFEKIDLLAVPDFAAGAMENTAAIFYRESDLLADEKTASIDTQKRVASVLAHEMAHQWFGDLVTMAWWDDLWLNEGFATWMANRPLAEMRPDWNIAVDEALETQEALELDSLASTRPIHATVETPAEIDASFDAIAYQKGAAVLRMVERFVGPDAFKAGVNAYLAKHAYGNATSEDFWTAMTASSGKPLDQVLSSFVSNPGAPLLTPTAACAAGRADISIAQERFTVDASPRPSSARWQIPVCVKTGDTAACRIVPPGGSFDLAADAGCQPWFFINAGAAGYYRTSYERSTLTAMAPRVGTALTAPERLSLLSDEWALVRAGRHTAGEFLTLASGFGAESSSGVFAQLAGHLGAIRTYLTTAETRPRLETAIRELFAPLAASLGSNTMPGEKPESTALRAEVMRLLGGAGGDTTTLEYARKAVGDALAGRAALEPTGADGLVAMAAQHGDAALFDAFLAASNKAVAPEDRYRYLYALTSFTDPALVQRGLSLALGDSVRSQDVPTFLAKYLSNPATNAVAWAFVKAHWKELEPNVVNFLGDINLTRGLGSFCDPESRADIVAFFKTHRLPTGQRSLAQSVNRIDNCIALRKTQTAEVTKWLADR